MDGKDREYVSFKYQPNREHVASEVIRRAGIPPGGVIYRSGVISEPELQIPADRKDAFVQAAREAGLVVIELS